MLPCRVYEDEIQVEPKLVAEFGTSRRELLHVVAKVIGARAEAVDDDPLGASGQFAYIFGTRNLRGVWTPKGWHRFREENVEAVRDPASGRQIVYQSVDVAGQVRRNPLAIRGKGSGARRLIDAGQGTLFSEDEIPERFPAFLGDVPLVWYFCVSAEQVDGELHVGAELSLPRPFKGNNFAGFLERIFIRPNGPWGREGIKSDLPDDGVVEFEPKITRKK